VSLRPDGAYRCDRCGTDVGNGAVTEDDKQAWTARSANPYADQAELCAFAAWTRAQWLAHPQMLENTAQWIADRCKARGIPPVKISSADVAARKAGVIGHINITEGLQDGTHTDPGKNFPWDVVMPRAQQILNGTGGFLMALTDAQQAQLAKDAQDALAELRGANWRDGDYGHPTERWAGDQEKLTVVGFLQKLDRQLNSVLNLANRPIDGATGDNEYGHVLSLRAEVADLAAKVDALAAKIK
jgi:hypothetical protein